MGPNAFTRDLGTPSEGCECPFVDGSISLAALRHTETMKQAFVSLCSRCCLLLRVRRTHIIPVVTRGTAMNDTHDIFRCGSLAPVPLAAHSQTAHKRSTGIVIVASGLSGPTGSASPRCAYLELSDAMQTLVRSVRVRSKPRRTGTAFSRPACGERATKIYFVRIIIP